MTEKLELLKRDLGDALVDVDHLRPREGLPTGHKILDQFLLWGGLPKGELTLLRGSVGSGASSLWIQTAQKIQSEKKWTAWVGSSFLLCPQHLLARGIKLDQLLVADPPDEDSENSFCFLQEMISSGLFECIGIQLTGNLPKLHQLQKLKSLARAYNVSLVFIYHEDRRVMFDIFSLIISFKAHGLIVERASHRPTPFAITQEQTQFLAENLKLGS